MDIRTKLILALVAVSLGSMSLLGAIVSPRVEGYIRDGTLEQLDELAESKRETLLWIIAGWRDRTNLVASRTQLRASLDEYERTGEAAAVTRIEAILEDAIAASPTVTLLSVRDSGGDVVASAARGPARSFEISTEQRSPAPRARADYAGVDFQSGRPQVAFTAPMTNDDRTVGSLIAAFDAREVLELTSHYHGLGDTGETLILAEDDEGVLRTLHATRHDPGREEGLVIAPEAGTLADRALAADEGLAWEGVTDYRGVAVWAATRAVPETGWGLVVKMDREEAARPSGEFGSWLLRVSIILSAFAIVGGFALGLRFALPIQGLAEVAERLGGGEMGARAPVVREDEVGLLARTFNEMAGELEDQMERLREFRKFFDVTISLMCIAGTDGFFKRTNPAFKKELGWSDEELLERPFFDFIHPDDVAKTEREVAKLAEGIPTISFENRYLCKDGSYKLLRWTSYPEGGVLYAIAHVIHESPVD